MHVVVIYSKYENLDEDGHRVNPHGAEQCARPSWCNEALKSRTHCNEWKPPSRC